MEALPPKASSPGLSKTGEPLPDYGNYSFGTGPAIATILKELRLSTSSYDTVAINLNTLIRNRVEKTLSIPDLLEKLDTEIRDLVNDLTMALQPKATLYSEPMVLLYLYDYEKMIPKEFQKESHAKTVELVEMLRMKIFKLINSSNTIRNGVRVMTMIARDQTIPSWKHLSRTIYNQKNNHHVIMISSYPLDYHICRKLPKFMLVNSHTGLPVLPDGLGEKVFDVEGVPFNVHTHVLMGDKPLMKSTLDRASKKSLINISNLDKWTLKTADYVRDKLKDASFYPPYSIE